MLYYYLLFFFLAVGAKLLLAMVMIYLLLPTDSRCNGCDEETLLLRPQGAGRLREVLTGGRVQRRWCPRCRWEGFSRRVGFGRPGIWRAARARGRSNADRAI